MRQIPVNRLETPFVNSEICFDDISTKDVRKHRLMISGVGCEVGNWIERSICRQSSLGWPVGFWWWSRWFCVWFFRRFIKAG